jgi:class 3 adenylate cyclase
MPELPRGTVSFLFTDIEGSTRLLQQLRDAYADVLGEHRRLLREAFEPAGGLEFGTEGDAVFVVFRRARDAAQAAADAQRMLAAHPWPDGAELRVRMGIHTGEPEIGPEGYTGLALHKAARICAAGYGGQVLLSNATRELVEDELPPETSLRDLGEHRLKDLDRPERIFHLVVQGLQSEFAPVRALEEPRRPWLRRPAVLGAIAAAIAAAVAIPVVALSGASGPSSANVAPNSVAVIDPKNGKVVDEIGVGGVRER